LVKCHICGKNVRKIRYIPLRYPFGTTERIPICKNRHGEVKEMRIVTIRRSPLRVVYELLFDGGSDSGVGGRDIWVVQ
jgi:hypothetical protein